MNITNKQNQGITKETLHFWLDILVSMCLWNIQQTPVKQKFKQKSGFSWFTHLFTYEGGLWLYISIWFCSLLNSTQEGMCSVEMLKSSKYLTSKF